MAYRPTYFQASEWWCKCGRCNVCDPLADGLLRRLDILRAAIGAPVIITSGWRCADHNRATPGASPTSYHLHGRAADITAENFVTLAGISERLGKLEGFAWTELIINTEGKYIHVAV
jgi:Uncharacterized protein conserved in bacteria